MTTLRRSHPSTKGQRKGYLATPAYKQGKKALEDGKEVALSRQAERATFDLYVPLGDLLKHLGGAVRAPQKGELKDFQKHLPVSLLVVDLK